MKRQTPKIFAGCRIVFESMERRRLLAFSAPMNYVAGENVVAGDFNSDARPDLIAYEKLLLGNGNGTFQSTPSPWTGGIPTAAGDFNRDGELDVVSLIYNGWSTVLGNGNGTFQDPQYGSYSSHAPTSATVGDLNGDGKPDLMLTSYVEWGPSEDGSGGGTGAYAFALLGHGDGTFNGPGPAVYFLNEGYSTDSSALADFNGDGKLDFVTARADFADFNHTPVSILLGNGNGTFQPPFSIGSGYGSAVAVGDVNGDNKQDVIAVNDANAAFRGVSIFLGQGDGTFQGAQNLSVGSNPSGVTIADVNADGKNDLAVSDRGEWDFDLGMPANGYASILLGNGDGGFLAAGQYSAGATSSPTSVLVGYFNSDTSADLAAVDSNGGTVSILLNSGNWPVKTWIGPVSGGNWSTASNWSPSGVPTMGDVVTISGKSVNLAASTTVGALNLLGGATLTLAANGDRVLRTSSLSISVGSVLDLADNDLLIDYTGGSPYADVKGYVLSGRDTGIGIVSSPGDGDVVLAVVDGTTSPSTTRRSSASTRSTAMPTWTAW